jgi:phosphate transport system substrate-binding protein
VPRRFARLARQQHRGRRLSRTGLASGALLVISCLFGSVPAGASANGAFSVSPANGLRQGQVVIASWSGLPQGATVYLDECKIRAITLKQCGQYTYPFPGSWLTPGVPVDASGSGQTIYQVASGLLNVNSAGGRTKLSYRCDSDNPCAIDELVDFTGSGNITFAHEAKITFAPPLGSCPANPTGQFLVGSGSSSMDPALQTWISTLCKPPLSQFVQYLPSNSVQGMDQFTQGQVTYAMTGMPLLPKEHASLLQNGRSFAYAPVAVDPVVFAYQLWDQNTQSQVRDLKLTPALLAGIFNGTVKSWANPDIQALNPGHEFSNGVSSIRQNILAYGRADYSAQTLLVTSWFEDVAKQAWEAGGSVFAKEGATYIMPSTFQISLITGGGTLASNVADPLTLSGDRFSIGWIGYMDAATAAFYNLPTVKIQNSSGNWVQATTSSVDAQLQHMNPDPNGVTAMPDFNTNDPSAYPLTQVEYALVPTSVFSNSVVTFDGAHGVVLRKFITWAVTDGQDALPPGYVPLTPGLASSALDAVGQIPTHGGGSPTPTPTGTSPSASYSPGPTYSTSIPPTYSASSPPACVDPACTTPTTTVGISGSTSGPPSPWGALAASAAHKLLPGVLGVGLAGILVGPVVSWSSRKRRVRSRRLRRLRLIKRDGPGEEA